MAAVRGYLSMTTCQWLLVRGYLSKAMLLVQVKVDACKGYLSKQGPLVQDKAACQRLLVKGRAAYPACPAYPRQRYLSKVRQLLQPL